MKTTQFIENQSPILDYFDQIYIINLEIRKDRLNEVKHELKKIGVDLEHPNITLYQTSKPTDYEGWPTAGAKGCFMSHLAILKDAQKNQYERILVLEDDVDFVKNFNHQMALIVTQLNTTSWDIFYGGYHLDAMDYLEIPNNLSKQASLKNLYLSPSKTRVMCTHCIAFNHSIISPLIRYLENMIARPAGDAAGGPMHVDGAFSWFRKDNPSAKTLLAYPTLAKQRSSRTDIHELKWVDKLPLIKDATNAARKLKNFISEAN